MPTKNGLLPLAFSIRAAMAPQAGAIPDSVGSFGSGLVAIKREPPTIRRMALVICSKL